ncbi:FAD-binding domain-containing protein [Dendrothele bispora CBS 962.96]|uniref:FAD-binding domain-containing protein n=1 Tax=Dendrothele bispora (strain CBS 962.96) TaxID=1314807 RepID=A0A4S8LZS7_DENBC|nr:FAD-binding domain-containing protein [Dendrothele bispora CBS 962.96]
MDLRHLILAVYSITALVEGVMIGDKMPRPSSSDACASLVALLPDDVHFPGSSEFAKDVLHYVESSVQNSTCSVEPQSVDDVGNVLKIIGEIGGHTSNANFSSTTGVQISMTAFDDVIYDSATSTVKIGTGQTWDTVYAKLEPLEINVVGGRIPGVGVGGLILGGGFSWITDQYGLSVDTVVTYDLVLPSGIFIQVNSTSDPDLFFGLKGGFNNFGIVTSGGGISFDLNATNLVNAATSNFSFNNIDSKAQMIMAYNISGVGEDALTAYLFYDAPTQPDVFDEFLNIPSLARDLKVRNFTEFLLTTFGPGTNLPFREKEHAVPILRYTTSILEAHP